MGKPTLAQWSNAVKRWVKVFGLADWDVYCAVEKLNLNRYAQTNTDRINKQATVILNTDGMPDSHPENRDAGDESYTIYPIPFSRTACHEVLHILAADTGFEPHLQGLLDSLQKRKQEPLAKAVYESWERFIEMVARGVTRGDS